jgi:putative salt-induced outer membrane protein YdiY
MNRSVLLACIGLASAVDASFAQNVPPQTAPILPPVEIRRLPPPGVIEIPTEVPPDKTPESAIPQTSHEVPVEPVWWLRPFIGWEGSLELGITGTEGNGQTFNIASGAELKREVGCNVLDFDFSYFKNSTDAILTAHRAFLDWKYERLCKDSPWTWFVAGKVYYDEFRTYDLRIAVNTGLGYQFIKNDFTTLGGRAGGGFSQEIGGIDDAYVPELIFGVDFEQELTKRQKLTAKVDYLPNVTDFGDFWLNTDLGWKIMLDEEANLSLKISVIDRYDSTPSGAEPNDINYAITLLWSF